ncbi:MAG: hypothetical protein GEU90_13390 [Gemmatimonas sp.]|nr:hypothetical protein [Gemmatimonas sp.]
MPSPLVLGDDDQLVELLCQLIANSVKFRRESHPRIHVSARRDADFWTFAVTDDRLGIDPEFQERVFDVFQRLGGWEDPGLGIGLAICRRIVERHGGRIWVESTPGEGSTFLFTLPVPVWFEA